MVIDEYLTVNEVATILKADEETIRRWSRDGILPASKFGSEWRYRKSDIDKVFQENINQVKK
jgi:excisionase family DNA binding protein